MIMRALFFTAIFVAIAGCNPSLRPYNGMVGFESNALAEGIIVSYVEDASYGWDFVEGQSLRVCENVLDLGAEEIIFDIQSKTIEKKGVGVSIPGPVILYTGNGVVEAPAGQSHAHMISSASGVDGAEVLRDFYKVVVACRPESVVDSP